MLRSGTTLVEQILASHSMVYGAGELNLMYTAVHETGGPSAAVDEARLARIRKSYLDGLAQLGATEPVITDKMPSNFLWLGFIVTALPQARVIHTVRDARATCWSAYRHYFGGQGNAYTYNLDDLVSFYRMYADLMAFWHDKFPEKIYDLSYERLTEKQEDETRKLLEYLELPWEDHCLNFHETRRPVTTASASQVRQKMYQGSSEEWRKYEHFLRPMIERLKGY